MKRVRAVAGLGLIACLAIAACGNDPIEEDSTDLVGLWLLSYQPTPTIYGFVSAQVIFREDATFLFLGHNPLSAGPYGEFRVTGTYTRTEDTLTLVSGDDAQTWNLEFRSDGIHLTYAETGDTFRLFRPLPD
jgi:hypothetical protein